MYNFIKVDKGHRKYITELFDGIEDSMVIAYLQGYMGDGYVDRMPDPTVGLIISGEYSFFGGEPDTFLAKELTRQLFYLNDSDETVAIFSESKPNWEKTLLSIPENNPKAVERYGIAQKDYEFDIELMDKYMAELPEEFQLKRFDADIYYQAMSEDWSKEFCETFASAEDYLTRGFGFAALKDGKLFSATSTMTVYDGGTEIQTATHPEFRRQGLALPTAAAFIKECVDRNMRPCWDAANLVSKHIALKLGYEYAGEYTTIHMHPSANRPEIRFPHRNIL